MSVTRPPRIPRPRNGKGSRQVEVKEVERPDRGTIEPRRRGGATPSLRVLWIPVGVAAAGMLLGMIGSLPIITVTTNGQTYAPGTCVYCPGLPLSVEQLPSGTAITVSWNEAQGAPVTFTVRDPTGFAVCEGYGASGTCAFDSIGGPYDFRAFAPVPPTQSWYTVNYSVSYHRALF